MAKTSNTSTSKALVIIALSLGGAAAPTTGGASVSAQAQPQNACALLTSDEIQALVPKEHAPSGVPIEAPSADSSACRYTWGTGARQLTLDVAVNAASRAYSGMNGDAIKQAVVSSVVPETSDASIPDVGQAAAFRVFSGVYVGASAYLKDRILRVNLTGIDAIEKKGQVVSLLKSAASRL